jgi:beta-lactamase class A
MRSIKPKLTSYPALPVLLLLAVLFGPMPPLAFGQQAALRQQIAGVIGASRSDVGVSVLHLEKGDTLSVNGKKHYPMQSVYKFPLAMAVLHQVDGGKLSLQQKIRLTRRDLLPDTWSPLRDKYPEANVDVTLEEILRYTVSMSDNNGCDVLFRLLGGTRPVDAYVRSLGVRGIAVAATEEEMHRAWDVQFTNWSEPAAMTALLKVFYQRKHLSEASSDLLWKLMVETSTGPDRIKGLLPAGTVVAHKTGTSDTNAQGIAAATNDAGIVTLPNGEHFAIVVYVANSPADAKTREATIARITRAVWDAYTAGPPPPGGGK